jgi:hypothetical protein
VKILASHVAWMLYHGRGRIPGRLQCLHTCNNGWCVNPAHLYLGTAKDNARDRTVVEAKVLAMSTERIKRRI